jgi:hypothetical protein
MSEKGAVKIALSEFVKQKAPPRDGVVCTVTSYDATTKTCYCTPVNEDIADIQQVKVCPDTGTGLFIQPKVNSKVMVEFMGDSSAFISMFSEFDLMNIGGDQYGGLTKTQTLKTEIDKLNVQLQAVITTLTGWAPAAGDGGAALKTAIIAAMVGKPAGVFTGIENTVIKHGNGTS